MTFLLDIKLALSEGVPELDRAVATSTDDLTVVGAEADAEHVRGVPNELTGSQSSVQVPQAEGVIPRGGEGELTVRGNDNVRDEMVVPVQNSLGIAK